MNPYLASPSGQALQSLQEETRLRRRLTALFACVLLWYVCSFFFSFLAGLVLGIAAMFLPGGENFLNGDLYLWLLQLIVYAPSLLVPFLIYGATQKFRVRGGFSTQNITPCLLIVTVFSGMALCSVSSLFGSFAAGIFESLTGLTSSADVEAPTSVGGIVLYFISLAILPPFVEEYIFRGIILRSLTPFGNAFAICVSSAIFAMVHGSITQWVATFMMGVIFGFLAIKTGSLWPSILLHFVNNATAAVQMLFLQRQGEAAYSMIFYPTQILLSVLGFVILIFAIKKNPSFLSVPEGVCRLEQGAKFRAFVSSPLLYVCLLASVVSILLSALAAQIDPNLVENLASAGIGGIFQ
ncbi:MAG: CPBP family intramembrane metalloprotease [Oscillospiraceae bacterium]|nr:CPBP family intramembrane metalloprotease [Oscillospiraceae bacterium]